MKKVSRAVLFIAAAVFALGVLMTGASLLTGGSIRHIRDNIGTADYSYYLAEESISAVSVDITAGMVVFREGKNFGVAVQNAAEAYFTCEVLEDGTLYVSESWPGRRDLGVSRVAAAWEDWLQVTVFVPESFSGSEQGGKVSVSADVGACYMFGTDFADIDVNIKAGLINLALPGSARTRLVEGSVGAGRITVGDSWFRGSYRYSNAGAGRPENGEVNFSCGAGEVIISFIPD